jgi:hypothetical protein
VEHVKSLEHFVSRPAIRKDVASPVTDVKTGSGRIREHIQAVVFGARIVVVRLIEPLRGPVFPPLGFNLVMVVAFAG